MTQSSAMLNDFLVTDMNENIAFFEDVLTTLKTSGSQSFAGNVYDLTISEDAAILSHLHDDSVKEETIDKVFLQTLLETMMRRKTR